MLVGGEREADFAHGDPFQSAILIALYSFPSFLPPRSLRARDRQIFLSADQFGIILSSFRVLSSISSRAPLFNDKDRFPSEFKDNLELKREIIKRKNIYNVM